MKTKTTAHVYCSVYNSIKNPNTIEQNQSDIQYIIQTDKEITTREFDKMFKKIVSWKQFDPSKSKDEDSVNMGFIGFISYYSNKTRLISEQKLLCLDDFYYNSGDGRLTKLLITLNF